MRRGPYVRQDKDHRMFPHAADQPPPSSLKMALKDARDFEQFKDELRGSIKYLQDFGGLASVHMIGSDEQGEASGMAAPPSRGSTWPEPEPEQAITERDLPAFVLQEFSGAGKEGFIAAINRTAQQR